MREAGVGAALGVPLHAGDEPIGLLVVFADEPVVAESDRMLLASLAAQLAVAVQNARLHERAKELGEALGSALASERQAARQLGALYEISRSFAQSLSLDTTLDAVTRTVVDVLHVDAAAIRVPAERGDVLVPRAVHVSDVRLGEAVRTILERPQPRPPSRLFHPEPSSTPRPRGGSAERTRCSSRSSRRDRRRPSSRSRRRPRCSRS